MKRNYFLLTAAALVLCGCTQPGTSSSASSSESGVTSSLSPEAGDIYEAVEKLIHARNYTLSTEYTVSRDDPILYDNIYTETYTYCNFPGGEEGFIQDENGIYRVNKYRGNLISSELFTDAEGTPYTDLWSSELFPSLSQLTLASFEAARGQKQFTLTSKVDKLILLDIMEVDRSYYTELESCTFYLLGSQVGTVLIDLQFSDASFEISVTGFGSSSAGEITDFTARGNTYTAVDPELLAAKKLFETDNYKRVCYNEENPDSYVIGYEWFTPNYWYGDYIVSEYQIYESGYLGLKKKQKDGKNYDGGYLFYLDEDFESINFYDYAPAFTTNISDITEIMNYPSKMKLWDYNLQFFTPMEDTGEYPGLQAYVTYDAYLIQDWLSNFQISLSTESGEQAVIYDLRIIPEIYTETPEYNRVTFQFDYSISGTVYGLQREFIDFGSSNIPVVDEFYASFEDQ